MPEEVGKLLNTPKGKKITGREIAEMLAQATVVPEIMAKQQRQFLEWHKEVVGPGATVGLIAWNVFLALLKERIKRVPQTSRKHSKA
jgi:hypothetical protein